MMEEGIEGNHYKFLLIDEKKSSLCQKNKSSIHPHGRTSVNERGRKRRVCAWMSVLGGLAVVVTRVYSFTHPTIRIVPFQPTSRGYK